jgi:hypothetical protein
LRLDWGAKNDIEAILRIKAFPTISRLMRKAITQYLSHLAESYALRDAQPVLQKKQRQTIPLDPAKSSDKPVELTAKNRKPAKKGA